MTDFKNLFKQLGAAVLSGLLVITVWIGTIQQAQASGNSVVPTIENSKRIQAIASCLPAKLTIQEQDAGNRIANALSEMKNDQLERIYDVTDNPKLSQSEIEFKTCLRQKGFTPQAELKNR